MIRWINLQPQNGIIFYLLFIINDILFFFDLVEKSSEKRMACRSIFGIFNTIEGYCFLCLLLL